MPAGSPAYLGGLSASLARQDAARTAARRDVRVERRMNRFEYRERPARPLARAMARHQGIPA
jgi:hypothetical protein